MPKFRKKPVEVEAKRVPEKWDGDSIPRAIADLALWLSEPHQRWQYQEDGSIRIWTLEGVMTANPGDWIIKGVKGEFYPCKPSVFEQTYEAM